MTMEKKWQQIIEDESIIRETISKFPIDDTDDNGILRKAVMTTALQWARKSNYREVSLAMAPLPKGANSEVFITELEKREDFRAYQKWWFDNQDSAPLSMELYMDWLEALRLLWKQLEE